MENKKETSEANFSLILLFIVAVFLFCHFPRLILNMAEFADIKTSENKYGRRIFMRFPREEVSFMNMFELGAREV